MYISSPLFTLFAGLIHAHGGDANACMHRECLTLAVGREARRMGSTDARGLKGEKSRGRQEGLFADWAVNVGESKGLSRVPMLDWAACW